MSQFEETAAPLLTPMFRGEGVSLGTEDEKVRVARWIFKTALMVDRSHKPAHQTVPNRHYRYLYTHRMPPPSATIALGLYVPAPADTPWAAWANTAWADAKRRSGDTIDGYRITFSVGHAIFETYSPTDLERTDLIFERGLTINGNPATDALRQLWPMKPEPHEWPPLGLPFTNAGLKVLEGEGL